MGEYAKFFAEHGKRFDYVDEHGVAQTTLYVDYVDGHGEDQFVFSHEVLPEPRLTMREREEIKEWKRKNMAFREIGPSGELVPDGFCRHFKITTQPTYLQDIKHNGEWQTVVVVALVRRIIHRDDGKGPKVRFLLKDDTGTLFVTVAKGDYQTLGMDFLHKAKEGKSLVIAKGAITPDANIMVLRRIKFISEIRTGGYRYGEVPNE